MPLSVHAVVCALLGTTANEEWYNLTHMQVLGYVSRVKDIESNVDEDVVTAEQIESNPVRCPDTDAAEQMYKGQLPLMLSSLPFFTVPGC